MVKDVIDDAYPVSIAKKWVEGYLDIVNVIAPLEVEPGTYFTIDVDITNSGGDDTGFVWVKDADSGTYYIQDGKFSAPGYSSFIITTTDLLMPNRNLNLMIEAGHVV